MTFYSSLVHTFLLNLTLNKLNLLLTKRRLGAFREPTLFSSKLTKYFFQFVMASAMDTSEPPADSKEVFLKRWLLENNVQTVDTMFKYDKEEQHQLRSMKLWERDPNYFKVSNLFNYFTFNFNGFQEVKMSALALLKMVIHAQSGGNIEIMGLMQGRIEGNTIIVMDSFALPVEGNFVKQSSTLLRGSGFLNYNQKKTNKAIF